MNVSGAIYQGTIEIRGRLSKYESIYLLSCVMSMGSEDLLRDHDRVLSADEERRFRAMVRARVDEVPMSYITGEAEFFGRKYLVTRDVLIPRPFSEKLVRLANELGDISSHETVLDIGTGSGCLAISLALSGVFNNVIASDISPAALMVAKKNALNLGAKNVSFQLCDLLPDARSIPSLIVANLPYLPEGLVVREDNERETGEPPLALYSGKDGLDLIRRLLRELVLMNWLGDLILELESRGVDPIADYCRTRGWKEVTGDRFVSKNAAMMHLRRDALV